MPSDQNIRLRALAVDRSFIVQAPAGSGKTEVLTQRFLRLLATVERPERVLAITFTRKATQEMRSRISKRLGQALSGETPESDHDKHAVELARQVLRRDQEFGWNLAGNPGRLRITTIDGLCVQLLSRDPVIGPQWSGVGVLEDARPLYREAIDRLFRDVDLEESASFVQKALVHLLVHMGGDSNRLQSLLQDMLSRRSLWNRHLESSHEHLKALLNHRQERAVEAFETALGKSQIHNAVQLADRLGYEQDIEGDSTEALLQQYFHFSRLLSSQSLKPLSPRSVNIRLFPSMAEAQRPLLNEFKKIYEGWHASEQAQAAIEQMAGWPPLDLTGNEEDTHPGMLLDSVRSVLSLALHELQEVFGDTGKVDFTAISDAAVDALGSEDKPGETLLAEDNRIDHILMDEFQDTSFMQFRLLLGLISGWQQGDGRTLFLVGDPMQSIYRFREANVGFFNEIVESGRIGATQVEPLSLTSNFRSRDELIDWYNRTFPSIFPDKDEADSGAVSYTPVNREVGPGGEVRLHALPAAADDGSVQGQTVALLVNEALSDPEELSIAILVRSRTQVSAIAGQLAGNGIRFEAVNMRPLGGQQVVQDLQILTRALLHPLDRVAWIALLRAPWCGLGVSQLHDLLGDDTDTAILTAIDACISDQRLDPESTGRLERISTVMHRASDLVNIHSISRRVEMCWILLGGPALCLDSTEIEDARVYLDLLRELENSGAFDLEQRMLEALEKKYASSRPARVQLMTMHGAKGLQFDVVIIPGLTHGTRGSDRPLLALQEFADSDGEAGVLMAAMMPAYASDTSLYQYLNRVDRERAQYESMRLLYVACTRARKQLHLVAEIKVTNTGKASIPAASMLTFLEHTFSDQIQEIVDQHEPEKDQADETAEPAPYPLLRLNQQLPDLEFEPVQKSESDGALRDLPNMEAVALGTVLHEWLELIHDYPEQDWSVERIEQSGDSIRSCLVRSGASAESVDQLQARCIGILKQVLFEEGWLNQLIDSGRSGSWSELPVYRRDGHHFSRHIIDLLVRDQDGSFHIIDYKTHMPSGEGESAWPKQLERYQELVEKLSGGSVSKKEIRILESLE
ncbi:MAG TPA: UvrD-helicase domain-containing protein [Xanthomonadales bacterium]|nr:UvrD-helicase domain-containing protein [Xanthomonadales bacterium]